MALPSSVSAVAEAQYRQQATVARNAARDIEAAWKSLPLVGPLFWPALYELLPSLTDRVTEGQAEASTVAAEAFAALMVVQGAETRTRPLPVLTPTVSLEQGFRAAAARAVLAVAVHGRPATDVAVSSRVAAVTQASTAVQDAAREVSYVQGIATEGVDWWVRKLRLPACKRCAILAGKPTRVVAPFQRHPGCDCLNVPMVGVEPSADTDVSRAIAGGQVTGLSRADTEAIVDHGAEPWRVVDAGQGTRPSKVWGSYPTRASRGGADTPRSGRYTVPRTNRPTPTQIARAADGDSVKIAAELRRHKYVV